MQYVHLRRILRESTGKFKQCRQNARFLGIKEISEFSVPWGGIKCVNYEFAVPLGGIKCVNVEFAVLLGGIKCVNVVIF